jgi:hypothetical protein
MIDGLAMGAIIMRVRGRRVYIPYVVAWTKSISSLDDMGSIPIVMILEGARIQYQ